MKKKLLALYYRPPELSLPQNSYGQYHILQAAKEVFETRILSFRSPSSIKQDENYFEPNYSFFKKFFNLVLRGKSPHLTHYFTREMFNHYKLSLHDFKPDLLYIDNLLMMQYPLAFRPESKVWVYDDDSHLYINKNKLRNSFVESFKNIGLTNFEKKALSFADKSFCISDEETNYLQTLGHKNVQTLSYPIDVGYYFYNWNPPKDEFRILFVGDFSHYPNKESAKIICKEIYQVLKNYGIKITLVGRNVNKIQRYLNKEIAVFENVPDVRPFYWNSNLFVAPIFSGSGMRIKILEAASCGIPIIMTSTANIGINLENQKEVSIINNINDFIKKIIEIYNSDLSDLVYISKNANQKIKSKFALNNMKIRYKKIFEELQ